MHMHKRGPTSAPNQAEVISLALMTKSTNHNDFLNRFQEKKPSRFFFVRQSVVYTSRMYFSNVENNSSYSSKWQQRHKNDIRKLG